MKKIMAAVKDTSDFSSEIVKIAAQISSAEKTELILVYVYEVPLAFPLDEEVPEELEKGDKILDHAVKTCQDFDIPVETHLVQARAAGSGILSEIKNLKVDMVVMGMKHNPVPGVIPIGTTADYILKAAGCRIILVRPEVHPQEKA